MSKRYAAASWPDGTAGLATFIRRRHPVSLLAPLATLVLLFGFQGEQIVAQLLLIALLAVQILFQVMLNSGLAYLLDRALRTPHCVAGPSALIDDRNLFELAVATAISLFGFSSGAALAMVVGVLIEVPVMLAVAGVINRTKVWYESRPGISSCVECCPTNPDLAGATSVSAPDAPVAERCAPCKKTGNPGTFRTNRFLTKKTGNRCHIAVTIIRGSLRYIVVR